MKKVIAVILLVILVCIAGGCGNKPKALPGVSEFIAQYPGIFGTIQSTDEAPDWADGKRQKVETSTGSYLFYLRGHEVVGVREYNDKGIATKQIYQK